MRVIALRLQKVLRKKVGTEKLNAMNLADVDIFLLCAGFGKRLKPLTDTTPKPLVTAGGKPLLARHLERLAALGARSVVINLHYLGQQIKSFAGDGSAWGLQIRYSEEPVLLDTGGGIKRIEPMLQFDSLLTINADVVIDDTFDYAQLVQEHRSGRVDGRPPLATMLLRKDAEQSRYGEIGIDPEGRVRQFLDAVAPTPQLSPKYASTPVNKFMFCGVQVLSRELLPHLPPDGVVCSITKDVLRPLVAAGEAVRGVVFDGIWFDVGTPERLESANKYLTQR